MNNNSNKTSIITAIFFICFVILEVAIYLLQKKVTIANNSTGISFYTSYLLMPILWLTMLLGFCQFLLWTHLLKKTDLSKVYCMSSLSYPITMFISSYMFNEHLPLTVWVGGTLISLGVFLIGKDI